MHLKRNQGIDILRTIGTLLIILAHVTIPNVIAEIRSFDVILLVMISGMCVSYDNYCSYIIRRFKRLVLPAWILEFTLFIATALVCLVFGREQLYSWEQIIRSFLFLNQGIGYIWIVRIYLAIALIIPLWIFIYSHCKCRKFFFYLSIVLIIIFSILLKFLQNIEILYYVFESIIYSLLAFLGFVINKQLTQVNSKKEKIQLICDELIFVIVMIVFLLLQGFIPNESKFPPYGIYIFYGLTISYILILLCFRISFESRKIDKCLNWFSKNSFNIYLVHILILSFYNFISHYLPINICWIIEYLIVLGLSCIGCIVLIRIKDLLRFFLRGKNE